MGRSRGRRRTAKRRPRGGTALPAGSRDAAGLPLLAPRKGGSVSEQGAGDLLVFSGGAGGSARPEARLFRLLRWPPRRLDSTEAGPRPAATLGPWSAGQRFG